MPELTEEQRKQWEEKIKNMSPEELQELQRQQCIFCQIIAGRIPSKKVYEDKHCLAILDINPAAKGHILLLPKEHYAIMPQVPEKILGYLSIITKHLSQVLLKVARADGTTVFIANGAAAGQRAQHFLVHLIPRKSGDGLLPAEEKLIGPDMALKVKAAMEKNLLTLLGGKKTTSKEAAGEEQKKDADEKKLPEQKELFITSGAAKRYHKEKCPFAQNIPAEMKITLSKEEAERSGRKPCTCVSGKKILLRKKAAAPGAKEKKAVKQKQASAEVSVKGKKNKEASLDDIANLFK